MIVIIASFYVLTFHASQSYEELSTLIDVEAIIQRGEDYVYSRSRSYIICIKYCELTISLDEILELMDLDEDIDIYTF